jgi:hypothetical protein
MCHESSGPIHANDRAGFIEAQEINEKQNIQSDYATDSDTTSTSQSIGTDNS